MNIEKALDILQDATTYEVRTDYSGRGMYGAHCLAVAVDDLNDVFRLMYMMGVNDSETSYALCQNARIDELGRGYIVYFPMFKTKEGVI